MDNERANPYPDKHRIAVEAFEYISLAVYLSGVDLVEEGHENERVEDDREVLVRSCAERIFSTAVDVEEFLSCESKIEDKEVIQRTAFEMWIS